MSDLFTPSEKLELGNNFNDIHDTWGRPITMFRQNEQIVIAESLDNNYIWDTAPNNTTTQTVILSGVFNARVLYGKDQKLEPFKSISLNRSEDQILTSVEAGDVRLKLDPTGAAFINSAKRATLDGFIFEITTSPRPHGLFTPQFFTYYLKKIN